MLPKSVKDEGALDTVRRALFDLLAQVPLIGLSLLGGAIQIQESARTKTMATDGRRVFYSPAWVHKKGRASIRTDLAHEWLHIYGNHGLRRGSRDEDLWGYAIDIRVAHDLTTIFKKVDTSWRLDADHVEAYPWAAFLTAEEIYEELKKQNRKPPPEYKNDLIPPEREPSEAEEQEFRQSFTSELVQAAYAEEQAGRSIREHYGPSIEERLQELRRCEVAWHILLGGRLIGAVGQEYATWVPPNRRWFPALVMPTRRGRIEEELLIGIDVSASIRDEDFARFRYCITPAARRARRTTVITFDQTIRECFTTERPDSLLKNLRFATGSHSYTSVVELFAEIEKRRPSATVVITDGQILLPEKQFPSTHWVLTPGGRKLPWGHNYMMNYSW